jgi:hypothetical protein
MVTSTDRGELSTCAKVFTELQFSSPPFPEDTEVELPVREKELGRDIPIQILQVGFGISAAMPLCWNQPNLTSE